MNNVLQSVDRANEMIQGRNNLIEELKKHPEEQLVPRLFALPMNGGGEDGRYRDCMEGMWKYSNDVIHFSSELSRALTKHGRRMEERFKRKFGALPFRTSEMFFDTEEALPLMPDKAAYASWEKKYILLISPTEGRRLGKAYHAMKKRARKLLGKPWKKRWLLFGRRKGTLHAAS
jgi:hypothetical protein